MVFTGRAVYDDGVWDTAAEDVVDEISTISPMETPLLDALPQAERPATSLLHEWLEEKAAPLTLTTSTALASTTSAGTVTVHDGSGSSVAAFLQTGVVLKVNPTGEYLQVDGVSGDDLEISRAQDTTSASSAEAGAEIFVIGDVALEGADVSEDTSRPRERKYNYVQTIKKDIIVSGTMQAQDMHGVSNEFEHQRTKKTREALRDLEKIAILGRSAGNTIGSSSAYRKMDGILKFISTNVTSTATMNVDTLNDVVKGCWDQGGEPDLIVADATWKRTIDQFSDSRIQHGQDDDRYREKISVFDSTYGRQRVMMNRYLPNKTVLVLDTSKIRVVPMRGRSFNFQRVSKTGDSEKGFVLGDYTLEFKNESAHAHASS